MLNRLALLELEELLELDEAKSWLLELEKLCRRCYTVQKVLHVQKRDVQKVLHVVRAVQQVLTLWTKTIATTVLFGLGKAAGSFRRVASVG